MTLRFQTGRFAVFILLLCVAEWAVECPLRAQAVRPVIAEYHEKARGRFDVVNDSLVPLNVILEAKSFSVTEDGSPAFRPLDNDIRLKLSQKSFRVPPQQSYFVFYEATAVQYPAWFVIYVSFSGLPQQSGMNVQVELPHTVYMQQKRDLAREEVRVTRAEYVPGSGRVEVELKNESDGLTRVSGVEVRTEGERTVHPGFPLVPHGKRIVTVEWKAAAPPQKAIVQFNGFKIETPLQERRN